MQNQLKVVKQENFGAVVCDFLKNEDGEIFMTRDQIGRALGYENPRDAIYRIHERNKDRLDKFSGVDKLSTPGGNQDLVFYSAKGVYEICRFSRQPKADAFMDWAWDVIETIHKTGVYNSLSVKESLKIASLVSRTSAAKMGILMESLKLSGINLNYAPAPAAKISPTLDNIFDNLVSVFELILINGGKGISVSKNSFICTCKDFVSASGFELRVYDLAFHLSRQAEEFQVRGWKIEKGNIHSGIQKWIYTKIH